MQGHDKSSLTKLIYNIAKPPLFYLNVFNGTQLKCINKGCSMQIRYSDVRAHDEQCPKLKIDCTGCSKGILQGRYEAHKNRFYL